MVFIAAGLPLVLKGEPISPSPPFRGEREGPAPQAWEGEVGVGEPGNVLIETAGGVAEAAAERGFRHEAEPDLVGDQHDRTGSPAQGRAQYREFVVDRRLGHHQVRQPQGQAIDQQRPFGFGLAGDHFRHGERRLDRAPEGAAAGAMRGDPRRHLIVARLGGRAIGAAACRPLDEGFGEAALARARAAQDQGQRGQLPRMG